MPSAREAVLEILEKSPGHQINLADLSKELSERRVLGFGVEVWDVVFALKERGMVDYDKETDIVSLRQPDEREKRLEEIRGRLVKYIKYTNEHYSSVHYFERMDAINEMHFKGPYDIKFLLEEIDRLKAEGGK